MNNASKLNILLLLIVCVLTSLLIKQHRYSVDMDSDNVYRQLILDFASFRIQNIEYHLEVLETLHKTKNIEEVKKQIEITIVNLFFQHSITPDISNLELNQSSLITMCRLYKYVREVNFEEEVSNKFSVFINTYYDENSDILDKLYSNSQINSDTCESSTPIMMPNFKKIDAEIEKLKSNEID